MYMYMYILDSPKSKMITYMYNILPKLHVHVHVHVQCGGQVLTNLVLFTQYTCILDSVSVVYMRDG